MSVPSLLTFASWVTIVSCDRGSPKESARTAAAPTAAAPTAAAPTAAPELVAAATELTRFLRGEVAFDHIRVADTVTLYLGPEAGTTRQTFTREMLRNPSNWTLHATGMGAVYRFAPPKGPAALTTQVGRHLVCGRSRPLSSVSERLAQLPHVGTTLRYGTESCLQTWNVTFVFDPRENPPTLVAAVYDQFEW